MRTVTTLPRGRAFTRRDLDAMPDDGHRYELIDGTLIVSPAPSPRHQSVLLRLTMALEVRRPEHLQLLFAPVDVVLAEDTVVQPDLLIAPRDQFTERDLPATPLLAVEVLLPSTRRVDLTVKFARYEAAGCPSYWVVDPDEPSLTAWELQDGRYVEVAHVIGEDTFEARLPFAVAITPAELLE